jgi:hypothetical protein
MVALGGLALMSTNLVYKAFFSFSSLLAISCQCLDCFSAPWVSFLLSSICYCNASSFFLYFFSTSQFSNPPLAVAFMETPLLLILEVADETLGG